MMVALKIITNHIGITTLSPQKTLKASWMDNTA
jgi:hypothetical protein